MQWSRSTSSHIWKLDFSQRAKATPLIDSNQGKLTAFQDDDERALLSGNSDPISVLTEPDSTGRGFPCIDGLSQPTSSQPVVRSGRLRGAANALPGAKDFRLSFCFTHPTRSNKDGAVRTLRGTCVSSCLSSWNLSLTCPFYTVPQRQVI